MEREAHGGVESRGVDDDLGAIRGELGSARHCDTAVAEVDRTVVDGEFEQRNKKSQVILVRHLVVDARQCDAVADVHPNQQMLILDLVGDFRTQLLSPLTLFANTENELVTHEPVLWSGLIMPPRLMPPGSIDKFSLAVALDGKT